jgi:hypothetical protein
MEIQIESTDVITTYNGARVRVWKGVTAKGMECKLFVAGIAVQAPGDCTQFEQELKEQGAPHELRTFDLRQVL